jgi:hypothetical protein
MTTAPTIQMMLFIEKLLRHSVEPQRIPWEADVGLRGPRAEIIRKLGESVKSASSEQHPWNAEGLTRAERVIRFVESLPCSAGPLAGTQFRLRPWQKKFVKAAYAG